MCSRVGGWQRFLCTGGGTWRAGVRRRLRFVFCCAGFVWLAWLAEVGVAQDYAPWLEPDAPARLVFSRPPQGNFCLVSPPAPVAGTGREPMRDGRAWFVDKARQLPATRVWDDPTNPVFLVSCRDVPARREIALYLFSEAQPLSTNLPVADPKPVLFQARRTAGQDLPTCWDDLLMLDARVDAESAPQGLLRFEARDGTPSGWYRGDWQRKNHLFLFTSWILVPVPTRLIFDLQTDLPAWLQLDGANLLEHSVSRAVTKVSTPPVAVPAGIHQVVVRGVSQQRLNLLAEWRQEGETNAPGVVALTGCSLAAARWERRNDRLHPMAVLATDPPYAFTRSTHVFLPLRLESRSVSREGRQLRHLWKLVGGGEGGAERELVLPGEGPLCKAVVCVAGGTTQVIMQVSDELGNTAEERLAVPDAPGPARMQYAVSGRLVGIPPCGYEDDLVRPELHVRATAPDTVRYRAEVEILLAGGRTTNVQSEVALTRSWGRLLLPVATAGAFQQISWRIRHAGVTLDQGVLRFDTPPFEAFPTRLDGEQLQTETNAVMLIAHRASAGSSPCFEGVRPRDRVLLLDGFLLSGEDRDLSLAGMLDDLLTADGCLPPEAYRRVSGLTGGGHAALQGLARLQVLVQAGGFLPADVVVVAPSLAALGQGESLAQFERRLAALTGLLTGPGRATVILVTPPPFEVLPGYEGLRATGGQAPGARQVAEIICRVADAHGLPVADLYTRFMTSDQRAGLLRNGGVTAEGLALAADVLLRILCDTRKEEP